MCRTPLTNSRLCVFILRWFRVSHFHMFLLFWARRDLEKVVKLGSSSYFHFSCISGCRDAYGVHARRLHRALSTRLHHCHSHSKESAWVSCPPDARCPTVDGVSGDLTSHGWKQGAFPTSLTTGWIRRPVPLQLRVLSGHIIRDTTRFAQSPGAVAGYVFIDNKQQIATDRARSGSHQSVQRSGWN